VNITDKEFLEGVIKIPMTVEEQTKIVDALEKINHLITLHQKKCDELQNIKKFMLQNMFI
ncbi:MAG: restriction endonuclease subunit S, partial [Lachnospiraceae bacterium]